MSSSPLGLWVRINSYYKSRTESRFQPFLFVFPCELSIFINNIVGISFTIDLSCSIYTWHICYLFCSVLTPYYVEDVLFSINDLEKLIEEDGVSILFYLQKIFPGSPPPPPFLDILSLTIISVGKTDMLFHKMIIYYRWMEKLSRTGKL